MILYLYWFYNTIIGKNEGDTVMAVKFSDANRRVAYMAYLDRENNTRHHYFDEDMKQYRLMQSGDPGAVEESAQMMQRMQAQLRLSHDPLLNVKYLFVSNISITTRFAIEGGMDSETAYNSSDLYISGLERCSTPEEVLDLHREMFDYFTRHMASIKKDRVYSRPVIQCMDYIDLHLHMPIRLGELAEYVKLNSSYLSVLFKKETGVSVSEYIMNRRIDTAKNMLLYSEYSASQIGEILTFSSQSHFIRAFKKKEGITPREYQMLHSRDSLKAAIL